MATQPASSARIISAIAMSTCRPCTASTSSSATSITSTPKRNRSCPTGRNEKDFPEFNKRFRPRGVLHCWAMDKDDPTEQPRWGRVGKQKIEDTGPLTKKRMETCDDDFVAAAKRLHQASARSRQAVLLLAQHDAHALADPYEARKPRPGRSVAVALSRHDDRPRQERRRTAGPGRRARYRR